MGRDKTASSLTAIGTRCKGKPDAAARILHPITSGPKVKSLDLEEDLHDIISTKDKAVIVNLIGWIRSLAKWTAESW